MNAIHARFETLRGLGRHVSSSTQSSINPQGIGTFGGENINISDFSMEESVLSFNVYSS